MTETALSNFHRQAIEDLPFRDIFYHQPEWVDLLTQLYGYKVIPLLPSPILAYN